MNGCDADAIALVLIVSVFPLAAVGMIAFGIVMAWRTR
jgi:nitrate reductase NapE component